MDLKFTDDQIKELRSNGLNCSCFPTRVYGDVMIPVVQFSADEVKKLSDFAKANSAAYNGILQKLSLYSKLLDNPLLEVKRLDALASAFYTYLVHMPNRFVFTEGGLPMLFTSADYRPSDKDSPAEVRVTFRYYHNGGARVRTLAFYMDDVAGGSNVAALMLKKGVFPESEELSAQYFERLADWELKVVMLHQQFTFTTSKALEPDDSDRDWRDWRSQRKEKRETVSGTATYRVVNDEDQAKKADDRVLRVVTKRIDDDGDKIVEVFQAPIWPTIYCFNLETHEHMWLDAKLMSPYVYDANLVNKLIIPHGHKVLLELLTKNPDTLVGDIVAGKSGGTIVLSHGKPGLGKTLAAEAFSEGTTRILYKVQSEQLGIEVDDIEKNLHKTFVRAMRWGAVLLLDEADIYIRKRGYDIHQNAIVGTILRMIEYYSGILFMTTNLGDDVDDAVISRASAVIKFDFPTEEDCYQIFRMFSDLFGVTVSDEVTKKFFSHGPNFKSFSGRTIKNVLRLTARMGKLNPTIEDLTLAASYIYGGEGEKTN